MDTVELAALALQIARRPATGLDVPGLLCSTSAALPGLLGLPASVIVILDPAGAFGSDDAAGLLGELQLREDGGPLLTAIRSGRQLLTQDLTRCGPPALAAAADESMLTSSGAMDLAVDGQAVGGLELLGTRDRPVTGLHLAGVEAVVGVLAALLADVRAQRRLADEVAATRRTAVPIAHATGMLAERHGVGLAGAAELIASRADAAGRTVLAEASAILREPGRAVVPSPRRRPEAPAPVARHRRPDGAQ